MLKLLLPVLLAGGTYYFCLRFIVTLSRVYPQQPVNYCFQRGNFLFQTRPCKGGATGGLTIGSASVYDSNAVHEFGHTIQFIGLSAVIGANGGSNWDVWHTYLALGIVGTVPYLGAGWEASADVLGKVAF
jgi:hypothetical protein